MKVGKPVRPSMCSRVYEETHPFGGVDTSMKLEIWIVRSPSELDSMEREGEGGH